MVTAILFTARLMFSSELRSEQNQTVNNLGIAHDAIGKKGSLGKRKRRVLIPGL